MVSPQVGVALDVCLCHVNINTNQHALGGSEGPAESEEGEAEGESEEGLDLPPARPVVVAVPETLVNIIIMINIITTSSLPST